MGSERRALTIALALTPGIGAKTIARIHTRNDLMGTSVKEFLALGQESLVEEYQVRRQSAAAWAQGPERHMEAARKAETELSTLGVQVVTSADAHYPRQIEAMDPDPPGVLFLFGNQKLVDGKTFAVLASRGASERHLHTIELWTEQRVLTGQILVSGHDTFEYQRASVVPLRFGAPRILVLDRGMFNALGPRLDQEPFATARLWRYQFDPTTDLVVSSLAPTMPYHRNSNRIRDRLIGSLARAIDVVEARPGGNMERIAKSAMAAGRPVRVSEDAQAAQSLVALGAQLVPSTG